MSTNYSVDVCGKWILAGEHAVLRGSPALVFPLSSRKLKLSFVRDESSAARSIVEFTGIHGNELEVLFRAVADKACEQLGISHQSLNGIVRIDSNIPIGAGLGASAALCVGIARWLNHLKFIPESQLYDFARSLENLFHGESSGVDIAVALSGEGLRFLRDGERKQFVPTWKPHWYLSYSGKRGVTLDCVQRVKRYLENSPLLGKQVDNDMRNAVELAEKALLSKEAEGLSLLVDAIGLANSCFERWGLITDQPRAHMENLVREGAVAVKPTGSGDGGYVLSLWAKPAPQHLDLIKC